MKELLNMKEELLNKLIIFPPLCAVICYGDKVKINLPLDFSKEDYEIFLNHLSPFNYTKQKGPNDFSGTVWLKNGNWLVWDNLINDWKKESVPEIPKLCGSNKSPIQLFNDDLRENILKYCEDNQIYDKLDNYGDFYYKLKSIKSDDINEELSTPPLDNIIDFIYEKNIVILCKGIGELQEVSNFLTQTLQFSVDLEGLNFEELEVEELGKEPEEYYLFSRGKKSSRFEVYSSMPFRYVNSNEPLNLIDVQHFFEGVIRCELNIPHLFMRSKPGRSKLIFQELESAGGIVVDTVRLHSQINSENVIFYFGGNSQYVHLTSDVEVKNLVEVFATELFISEKYELSPCPMCGKKAIFYAGHPDMILCEDTSFCGVKLRGIQTDSSLKVIEKWNKRYGND